MPLLAKGDFVPCERLLHKREHVPCVSTALITLPSISTDLWSHLTGEMEGSLRQSLATFSVVMTTMFALKWMSTVLWRKGTICCMIRTPLKPEKVSTHGKQRLLRNIAIQCILLFPDVCWNGFLSRPLHAPFVSFTHSRKVIRFWWILWSFD